MRVIHLRGLAGVEDEDDLDKLDMFFSDISSIHGSSCVHSVGIVWMERGVGGDWMGFLEKKTMCEVAFMGGKDGMSHSRRSR